MTKSKEGTIRLPGATAPKWPRPRSGKIPDNARKDITTKADLLGPCINTCFAVMRQYYDRTFYDKLYDKLEESYWRALDLKSEIAAIVNELQDLSPEEHAAYKQINAAIDDLNAFRFDFNSTPEVAAKELRADAERKKEARRKAEETAKLKAETKARAKAEEKARKKEQEQKSKEHKGPEDHHKSN